MSKIPSAPVIEIIERRSRPLTDPAVIVPNDVRINGQSILCSDDPVIVHEIRTAPYDAVRVTLTVLARRVVIDCEVDEPEDGA